MALKENSDATRHETKLYITWYGGLFFFSNLIADATRERERERERERDREREREIVSVVLVYGISIFEGYSMPNRTLFSQDFQELYLIHTLNNNLLFIFCLEAVIPDLTKKENVFIYYTVNGCSLFILVKISVMIFHCFYHLNALDYCHRLHCKIHNVLVNASFFRCSMSNSEPDTKHQNEFLT